MSELIKTTIVFPVRGDEVLLAMKARGFGAGWWNGFGGKLDPNETFADSARRETKEEVGLRLQDMHSVAELLFYFDERLTIASLAYVCKHFRGEPTASEEMINPTWFRQDALPYDNMWPGDEHWIPDALKVGLIGPPVRLAMHFDADNNYLRHEPADPKLIDEIFPS